MGANSLLKTVTRQRRGCDLNPGPTAPESSTLTTRLLSRLTLHCTQLFIVAKGKKTSCYSTGNQRLYCCCPLLNKVENIDCGQERAN